jgi:hypothetical protein
MQKYVYETDLSHFHIVIGGLDGFDGQSANGEHRLGSFHALRRKSPQPYYGEFGRAMDAEPVGLAGFGMREQFLRGGE